MKKKCNEMASNILNLPAYTVTESQENSRYCIYATVIKSISTCIHCFQKPIRGFGHRKQQVKDLPINGKCVSIYIDTRRYQCLNCNKTFYERLPDIDEKRKMTRRLVDWIGKQAVLCTFTSIAKQVGVVEGTVRAIFCDYSNKLEKTAKIDTPEWLSIDVIHLIKPRCIIGNIKDNKIIKILKDQNTSTITDYLRKFKELSQIKYVMMAVWLPYRKAIESIIPHAKIIINKCHLINMANNAVTCFTKSLGGQLAANKRRSLSHDKLLFLNRHDDLNAKELLRLDKFCKNYPELALAYRQKEEFYRIYDAQSPDEAISLFNAWKRKITPTIQEAYSDLIITWQYWEPYICNYFKYPTYQYLYRIIKQCD